MDENLIELCKHRMAKAEDDLEGSELLLSGGKFAQSLNRSYYAMFHATRALLTFDKVDSKKHSGVIRLFNMYYLKPGIFDNKLGKVLIEAEKIRTRSDYDDFYVASKQQAERQLVNAKEFIATIKSYLSVTYGI